jgi:TfoX/Sxy family transcriptional regulator of competence genes
MATRPVTVDFILEQMAGAGAMSARKMFGEYGVYRSGVLVALICDDQLFVKPSEAGRAFLAECEPAPPYPVAKPWWRVGDALLEDSDRLCDFVRLTYGELALAKTPAKKKPRAPRKGKS